MVIFLKHCGLPNTDGFFYIYTNNLLNKLRGNIKDECSYFEIVCNGSHNAMAQSLDQIRQCGGILWLSSGLGTAGKRDIKGITTRKVAVLKYQLVKSERKAIWRTFAEHKVENSRSTHSDPNQHQTSF